MSLAVISGHCYQNYWARIGDSSPLSEAATLVLGLRYPRLSIRLAAIARAGASAPVQT